MAINAALAPLAQPFFKLIDQLFTSDDERAAAKLKLLELDMQPLLAQMEVNKAEASNPNWFVAGWRPAIGWTCGFIFLYTYVLRDFLLLGLSAAGIETSTIPTLSMTEVLPIMLGMLGLGGFRTYEKSKGTEGNR